MHKGKIIILRAVVILILLFNGVLNAQTNNQKISSIQAREVLDKIYGLDQRLVSGRSYAGEAIGSIIGHPYWIDSSWKIGNVTINGVLFPNLLLKFDISEYDLVLNTSNLNNQSKQLCLNKNAISEFFLGDRKFIRFPGNDSLSKVEFCEVCAEGRLSYLVTRSKSMILSGGSSTDFKYREYIGNYLLFEGSLIKYKNKKTLYKLFPELKNELRNFIYQNAITITRKNTVNRERLVEYCNLLIDQS
ncbi:MAG: hypothetical protein QNK33_08725 [Bacteroidales bacterium]|nr:hypothetical protein [Bacteroidales bacterium]